MVEWLDKQMELEEFTLDGISENLRELLETMMPQIRLAALEHGDTAEVELGLRIRFTGDGADVTARGGVHFPAKGFETQFEL
tara:strand:- start:68 stop:313 length:246 start_codon:yes stop_codon:yes gene_type:complete